MTQMLFCGFKNIFISNKSQLPKKDLLILTSSNNPLPSPSKNQGSSNKTKQTTTEKSPTPSQKGESPNNFQYL